MATAFVTLVAAFSVQARIRVAREARQILASGIRTQAVIVEKERLSGLDLRPDRYTLHYEFQAADGSVHTNLYAVDEAQFNLATIGDTLDVIYNPTRPHTVERLQYFERNATGGSALDLLGMLLVGAIGGLIIWLILRFVVYPRIVAPKETEDTGPEDYDGNVHAA